MLGDRIETPASEYGWPKCDLCNKPVDKMRAESSVFGDMIAIVVECHGAREVVEFPKSLLVGPDALRLDGRAFIRAKQLTSGDASTR